MSAGARAAVWRAFGWAGLRLSALFAVVFYGADAWAASRPWRWQVHAGWELAIPYWPAAYLPYHSVLLLPFLVPPLVGGVQLTARLLEGRPLSDLSGWLKLIAAFDVAFVTLAAILFPVVLDE